METGSVATSPIVTTAGTASRVADVVSLASASSLIGQSAGTLYAEVVALNFNSTTARRILSVTDGTTSNGIVLTSDLSQNLRFRAFVRNSASNTAEITQSADNTANTVIKLALAYAVDDVAFYVNGASIGTDTSTAIPACSQVEIGSWIGGTQFINGHIRSVALFPTRLANATLASLTA
jgi:hypothetical protein